VNDEPVVTEVSEGSAAEVAGVSSSTVQPTKHSLPSSTMHLQSNTDLCITGIWLMMNSWLLLVAAPKVYPLQQLLHLMSLFHVLVQLISAAAAAAAGLVLLQCRVGDVVRATSAMTMQMVYPTVNIFLGGERT
jgi:hypothetical protein